MPEDGRLARYPIEFFAVVPSGEQRQIAGTVKPGSDGRFVPLFLGFAPLTADRWTVSSLMIGEQDVLVAGTPVPAAVFEGASFPRMPGVAATVDRGVVAVSLTVQNATRRSKVCRALLHPFGCACPVCVLRRGNSPRWC